MSNIKKKLYCIQSLKFIIKEREVKLLQILKNNNKKTLQVISQEQFFSIWKFKNKKFNFNLETSHIYLI